MRQEQRHTQEQELGKEITKKWMIPVFPNWFPYNNMVFDGHLKVGKYAGVKTRSWQWDYRGPVLFYNSLRTEKRATQVYEYENDRREHKVIIGIADIVESRPLTIDEAKQMLANFNNMPLASVEQIIKNLRKEGYFLDEIIYNFYDFGPYVAPYRGFGFFFQNLRRFETYVPFNWPSGPVKPIFINTKENPQLVKQLKLVGYDIESKSLPMDLARLEVSRVPATGQISVLEKVIRNASAKKERVIVILNNERAAEDLSEYLNELGLNTRYFHTEIAQKHREQIVKEFEKNGTAVVIAANTIEELPRVTTVVIIDADKDRGLRNEGQLAYYSSLAIKRVVICADKLSATIRSVFPQLK